MTLRFRPTGFAAIGRLIAASLVTFSLMVQPAAAQSILRDAETEAFFRDMARPLVEAAGLSPANVQLVLVGDRSINAFVAGGQIVYINSGILIEADNANEVQGVVAHELGHITGGHVILTSDNIAGASNISILSLLVGAAAMLAGAGEAGMGMMSLGQQAALGKYLAFSRAQESAADAAGASYLTRGGITGKGYLSFFGKLRQQEHRYYPSAGEIDPFMQSHPMSAERAATLEGDLKASPSWNKPSDPALEQRFRMIKAKLIGYVEDPPQVIRLFPERDQSPQAHYARAYAYHRGAYPDRALAEADALVKQMPENPYALELRGQILLESGKPKEALPSLRQAVKLAPDQPLIASTLGHALISTEDPGDLAEARAVLRTAVAQDRENPFAWYQLGLIYTREGDEARAALASAERYNLEGRAQLALVSAERAMQGITPYTPDWLRAQDISMVSRNEIEADKKKRK